MKRSTVLGWDAAWTPHGSGAWCGVEWTGRKKGTVRFWEKTPTGREALTERLNTHLTETAPDLVAIDMPIAEEMVTGYREADRQTTKSFSRYGCPVHSPLPDRPGEWGNDCMQVVVSHGYRLSASLGHTSRFVAEVYPHSALLEMLRLTYRFPYKVSRAKSYWPELSPDQARKKAKRHLRKIFHRLAEEIDLPAWEEVEPAVRPARELKAFEDRLDALICAWAGLQIIRNNFIPYGNGKVAIWNPDLNNLDPPNRIP